MAKRVDIIRMLRKRDKLFDLLPVDDREMLIKKEQRRLINLKYNATHNNVVAGIGKGKIKQDLKVVATNLKTGEVVERIIPANAPPDFYLPANPTTKQLEEFIVTGINELMNSGMIQAQAKATELAGALYKERVKQEVDKSDEVEPRERVKVVVDIVSD